MKLFALTFSLQQKEDGLFYIKEYLAGKEIRNILITKEYEEAIAFLSIIQYPELLIKHSFETMKKNS